MLVIGSLASAIAIAVALAIDWFPEDGSTSSDEIDTLWDVLLVVSIPIFALVMTVALFNVWKYRARPGDMSDGPPIHGDTKLEVIWVTIPAVIVAVLSVYGWVVLDNIEDKREDRMIVEVTGQQFAWSFQYPMEGGKKVPSNELVLPEGRQVEFKIRSKDVIHSFWIPEFRLKSDAVPGITTEWRATPKGTGTHQIVCAELCGIGHSTMRQSVRVVPEPEFTAWLDKRSRGGEAAGAAPGSQDQAAGGKQVFNNTGCNTCHTLSDAEATGEVGPSLDELGQVAGERKPGTKPEDYVRESIVDPAAFAVEGFDGGTMPADYEKRLTPEEIDSLVEYLLDVSSDAGGESG